MSRSGPPVACYAVGQEPPATLLRVSGVGVPVWVVEPLDAAGSAVRGGLFVKFFSVSMSSELSKLLLGSAVETGHVGLVLFPERALEE